MKTNKPIAVHLDRLAAALAEQGFDLKRTKILELTAAAFGYHNTHECTAASQRGDLTPPAAEPICRVEIPGGEALIVMRDPVTNAPYAIDETFIEQVIDDERREAYGPSPYGRMLDLSEVSAHPATAWSSTCGTVTTPQDGILRILVELEKEGVVTDEVVRSNVHQAIHSWRSNAGLSADDDEGMIGEIMTRVLGGDVAVPNSEALPDQLLEVLRTSGRTKIHVALIHHKHGIDVRLGTTLASVSRQVGDYVRENWDDAWQADQDATQDERSDIPETPEGLDDDQAEQLYFQAVGRYSASNYVDYEVIDLHGSPVSEPAAPIASEPFPGVPEDLWEIYAARDGDTVREVFRAKPDEDPEMTGRKLAAKAFSLDLEDYLGDWMPEPETPENGEEDEEEFDDEPDYSIFDGDLDGIEICRADFDPTLKATLQLSWEAANRLPAGDPLRDRIRRQVFDAMPKADA